MKIAIYFSRINSKGEKKRKESSESMKELGKRQFIVNNDICDEFGHVYIKKGKVITIDDSNIEKFKHLGIWDRIVSEQVGGKRKDPVELYRIEVDQIREKYIGLDQELLSASTDVVQEIMFEEHIFKRYPHMKALAEYAQWYYSHSVNVAILSVLVAIKLGYNKETVRDIGIGAVLHDIGVVFVDKAILDKDLADLTEDEINLKAKHCELGVLTVRNMDVPEKSQIIIEQHHEKMDGTGLPKGLTKEEIIDEVRLVSAIDALDSETSKGVVRTVEEVVKAMYDLPERYDRKITSVLKEMLCS